MFLSAPLDLYIRNDQSNTLEQRDQVTIAAYNLTRMRTLGQLLKQRNKAEKMKNTPIKSLISHQCPHWSTDSLYIKQEFSTRSAYQRLFPDFSAAC
jgi:hypothetical protein